MSTRTIHSLALKRLKRPDFLASICSAVSDLGVVGEDKNALLLFIAGLTKALSNPVSVLVKGSSSSGKSNLVRNVLKLFPQDAVISRASLSKKAPAYGKGDLTGKIWYMAEHRGGKDAQLL